MEAALVVPTIRERNILPFLKDWQSEHWDIFVVEDNPTKQFALQDDVRHYSWNEIDTILGENSWIISRRDSAIRSFGFLMAYRAGAEIIYTLDDDCIRIQPSVESFQQEHLKSFCSNKWTELYPGQRTRGLPYYNKGFKTIALNVGLWTRNPDLDAIQTLSGSGESWPSERPPTRLIPRGQYFPMSGMNLCFRRSVVPLMYFPLMGEGYPYRRFDDIWCGIIMKKICDHLDLSVSAGHPYIEHARASDPFVNLVKEAPGIAANEGFWEEIDSIPLKGTSPIVCMKEVGEALREKEDKYLSKLGKAIVTWTEVISSNP